MPKCNSLYFMCLMTISDIIAEAISVTHIYQFSIFSHMFHFCLLDAKVDFFFLWRKVKPPTSVSYKKNAQFEKHVSICLKFHFLALTTESNIFKQWQRHRMQTVCFSFWSQVRWWAAQWSTTIFIFPFLGSRKVLQFESLAKFKFNYIGMKNDPPSTHFP